MPLYGQWQTKPPVGTRINWSHPLAWGLVGAWTFNEGGGTTAYNAVAPGTGTDGIYSGTGSPGWTNYLYGPSLNLTAADDEYFNCGVLPGLAGATSATFFALGNASSSLNWFAVEAYSSANLFGLEYVGGTAYFSADTSYSDYGVGTTGDFNACTSWNSQANSGAIYGYWNGKLVASNGTYTSAITSTGYDFYIGYSPNNSAYTQGRVDLVLVWVNRSLSAAEYFTLQSNPWQLYAPPSAWWLNHEAVVSPTVFPPKPISLFVPSYWN